jgi:hypothetical protein
MARQLNVKSRNATIPMIKVASSLVFVTLLVGAPAIATLVLNDRAHLGKSRSALLQLGTFEGGKYSSLVSHLNLKTEEGVACDANWLSDPSISGTSNTSEVHFIHIPKTGGSSIELSLTKVNISVGAESWLLGQSFNYWQSHYNFSHPEDSGSRTNRNRTVALNIFPCVPWHVPPTELIPNSFTVVRDPLERLESEFKHQSFSFRGESFSRDVRGFESWILSALRYAASTDPFVLDCHLIRQYDFVRQVSLIVPYRCLHVIWGNLLGTLYRVEVPELHIRNASKHEGWNVHVSKEIRQLVRKYYAIDYLFLGNFF